MNFCRIESCELVDKEAQAFISCNYLVIIKQCEKVEYSITRTNSYDQIFH